MREWLHCGFRPARAVGLGAITARRWRVRPGRAGWILLAAFSGSGRLRVGQVQCELRGGSICVLPPGVMFAMQVVGDAPLRVVDMSFNLVQEQPMQANPLRVWGHPVVVQAAAREVSEAATRLQRHVMERPFQAKSAMDRLHVGLILEQLMTAYLAGCCAKADELPQHAYVPAWLAELRAHIETRAYDHTLGMRDLAAFTGYSAAYIQRGFARAYGESVFQFVQRYRIAQACRLLRADAADSVAEIAARCGYANVSLFHRQFRRLMKMRPLEYKRCAS